MANFVLQVPNNLRSFTVSASVSSNGSPPLSSSGGSGGVGGPVILELPLDKIRRPLMRTRANDPIKVQELMDSISEIGLQTPIDVLEVEGVYYGITSADFLWVIFQSEFAVFTKLHALFGFCGKNWDGRALHLKFWVRLGVLLEHLKALSDNQKRF
ncbi:hypothetical protein PRUPE_4G113200 [Prunus persica]|uniref:sulfiredoxin n=1 Tax=Prunus persica TaxID=3760 RepID=A0A251PJ29_PRUPE|nr:hypothetical protein PRUPE_4G113200 [Prunus persica]